MRREEGSLGDALDSIGCLDRVAVARKIVYVQCFYVRGARNPDSIGTQSRLQSGRAPSGAAESIRIYSIEHSHAGTQ